MANLAILWSRINQIDPEQSCDIEKVSIDTDDEFANYLRNRSIEHNKKHNQRVQIAINEFKSCFESSAKIKRCHYLNIEAILSVLYATSIAKKMKFVSFVKSIKSPI